MLNSVLVLVAGFLLDLVFGDPRYAFHPARLMGRIVTLAENGLRKLKCTGVLGGAILAFLVTASSVIIYLSLRMGAGLLDDRLVMAFDIFMLYSSLALSDLVRHSRPIASALARNDIACARHELQQIVGRDTSKLDKYGTARAAIESVAENFLDGFLSPVIYYLTAAAITHHLCGDPVFWGVASVVFFKAISTLDSMVGYRNELYSRFGRVSARLDDILNFIPARLSLPFLYFAAIPLRLDANAGSITFFRDRLKHSSPNAGHAESFAAGALGLKLGGPSMYPHGMVDKPWLGSGSEEAGPLHIRRINRLVLCSGWLSVILLSLLTLCID